MTPDEFKQWIASRYPQYGGKGRRNILQAVADQLGVQLGTVHKYCYGFTPIGRQTVRIIELMRKIDELEAKLPIGYRRPLELPAPTLSDRDRDVIRAYRSNGSLRATGATYGLSHEAVRKILNKEKAA